MIEREKKVVVIYLAWLPYGIEYFKVFIESYLQHTAGYQHKLVILFNGQALPHPDNTNAYINHLQYKGITATEFLYFNSGQDIEMYKKAAQIIEADYFLFLNTYSLLKNTDWLLHYINNWHKSVGLIGATGSYANYYSAIKTQLYINLNRKGTLSFKLRELKYFIKLFFIYRTKFKKFPAPHIRTTGFFTSKAIFLSVQAGLIKNKMEAYFFENGKNSMTAQVLKMGYKSIVIDKNGKSYAIQDWVGSKTFWSSRQENLLIADNQTQRYEDATDTEKKILRKIAWNTN